MAEYLSPGVYVEEYDHSPRALEGVGTSTAGFVGLAQKGPVSGAPVLVTSYADFIRKYGDYLSGFEFGEYRYLAGSVEQFFANGGTKCFVARVIPPDAKKAEGQAGILKAEALSEGSYGNRIVIHVETSFRKKMQLISQEDELVYTARKAAGFEEGSIVKAGEEFNRITSIFENQITFEKPFTGQVTDESLVPEKVLYLAEMELRIQCGSEVETYDEVNLNIASGNYIATRLEKSSIVKIKAREPEEIDNPVKAITGEEAGSFTLSGGSDGTLDSITAETFIGKDEGPGRRTGIQAFLENSVVSIMAVPGITIPEVVISLISHCENTKSRFAVIDMPKDLSVVKEITEYREMVDSTYAAMYHPWIQAFDRSSKKPDFFPPSGAVMGVYARTDTNRGVHKAPANETVACTGLNIQFTKQEQDFLNPVGVNLIRSIPGQGIRIWGARTASSNAAFKYVNVRRLFIYVEESIKANTNWVVFEPNDSTLWTRVRVSISSFLETLWRNGMLAGGSPSDSFFVEIGPTTMTPDDISSGRLICNIGIAPVKPAEFVIFRVTQHTSESVS